MRPLPGLDVFMALLPIVPPSPLPDPEVTGKPTMRPDRIFLGLFGETTSNVQEAGRFVGAPPEAKEAAETNEAWSRESLGPCGEESLGP